MELNFDKHKRIFYEGSLDYNFKCFSNAIQFADKSGQEEFISDIRKAFNSSDVVEGEKYSQGSTNFIRADQAPSCTLERLALAIFDHHTSGAQFDRHNSGAEWWTLYLENYDDVGFHWDRDYGIEDEFDTKVHPHLATVTYMSAVGGPTIVLDVQGFVNPEDYGTQSITSCVISKPAIGKHVVFDGQLLHGAPAKIHSSPDSSASEESDSSSEENDDNEDSTSRIENPRVTFLVNIWLNHIPIQSNTSLPESVVAEMNKDTNNVTLNFSEIRTPSELSNSSGEVHQATWGLSEGSADFTIHVPLPSADVLEASLQSNGGQVVTVDCSMQAGVIVIAESDAEDNNECSSDDSQDPEEGKKVEGDPDEDIPQKRPRIDN